MNEQLLVSANGSYNNKTERNFKKEKEYHYKNILDGVHIEANYQSKTVKCNVCKDNFYYINSKDELIKLIDETIDENGHFPIEMIKLMSKFYYPGSNSISFLEKEEMCFSCYNIWRKQPKKSLFSKIKSVVCKNK